MKIVLSVRLSVHTAGESEHFFVEFYGELCEKFSVDKKNQLDVTFLFFISLLIVAQHVSGNHVPIIRS